MGMISIRFDETAEEALRRAARRAGMSVSDYVRHAVQRTLEQTPAPTLRERLGDVVGRFDSAAVPAPTEPDELSDYLQAEHERQATESRALRKARDAR